MGLIALLRKRKPLPLTKVREKREQIHNLTQKLMRETPKKTVKKETTKLVEKTRTVKGKRKYLGVAGPRKKIVETYTEEVPHTETFEIPHDEEEFRKKAKDIWTEEASAEFKKR